MIHQNSGYGIDGRIFPREFQRRAAALGIAALKKAGYAVKTVQEYH